MLSPKRVKFRKMFKGRTRGLAKRGSTVAFGHYGLQALEPGWVTNRQIEAARVALTRHIKRGGKVWIGFSRTSRSPRSPPRPAWERARGRRRDGWPW